MRTGVNFNFAIVFAPIRPQQDRLTSSIQSRSSRWKKCNYHPVFVTIVSCGMMAAPRSGTRASLRRLLCLPRMAQISAEL
jgi:hypothetical protein